MTDLNLFEQATKRRIRFSTLSTEDLWNLPLTSKRGNSLDAIAMSVYRELKATETDVSSFVGKTETNDRTETLQLMLDVVKRVIEVRQAENAERLATADKMSQIAKLRQAIAEKNEEAFAGMSLDELKEQLAALEASA